MLLTGLSTEIVFKPYTILVLAYINRYGIEHAFNF
jgi:hypothetical protein